MDAQRHAQDPYARSAGEVSHAVSLPIQIEGTLAIAGPGIAATVSGQGREVVCDLASLWAGWSMLQQARRARVFHMPLEALLTRADLSLSVRFRGRVIAEAGPGIVTGRLAALCGLPGVRLRSFRRPLAC